MEEVCDGKFIDSHQAHRSAAIPIVFIYDRTAALNEGDDQKEALLYPLLPAEETEEDRAAVTKLLHLIGQVMGLISKLEQEIGASLPSICRLEDVNFFFLHIGKYTVSLRRPSTYPEKVAESELEMLIFLFNTFYGGFSTAEVHTTETNMTNNPDKIKVKDIDCMLKFLEKICRPHLAECLGSWTLQTSTSSSGVINKKLINHISLLLESLYTTHTVVGALAMVNGRLVLSKNLQPHFIQLLTLILAGEIGELGNHIQFVVENVTVLLCHLTEEHLISPHKTINKKFHVMMHIHGDLSLTLIVHTDTNPLCGLSFQDLWRRPCTKLKDELLHLHHQQSSAVEELASVNLPSQMPTVRTLHLHKPSNVVHITLPQSSGSEAQLTDSKKGSSATLAQSSQHWNDWYAKSLVICQQAFTEMPSISEIRLVSPTDSVVHATQDTVTNSFFGSADVRNTSTFPGF